AAGRGRGHGRGPRARLPGAPAARPAAGGARGGGDRVRRARAVRRAADHGLDRGAAGAARPRRGLRDPVPGARAGGRAGGALGAAAVGWAVDSRATIVSDLQRLVPQNLGALRDLRTLQGATGVAGEVDVLITSPPTRDLTSPRVVDWMRRYQDEILKRHGYTA